jgi:hypothetical protein
MSTREKIEQLGRQPDPVKHAEVLIDVMGLKLAADMAAQNQLDGGGDWEYWKTVERAIINQAHNLSPQRGQKGENR